jgi:hypothetical protein
VVDFVDEAGKELVFNHIRFCKLLDLRKDSVTYDSTPKISHTRHASFLFFLYAWPMALT